jgi:uncharacterized membrane protein
MGPELLYVRDSFDSRMNTVFKLYYQGWVVLAAASGIAIFYWLSARASLQGWSRTMSTLWAGVFVVVLVASLYYAPAAAVSKGDPFEGDATLDGLAYVRDGNRAEYDAIDFIKGNLRRGSAILEATGDDYTEFGRISASTGVPTVLNWPGHEIQWRGTSEKFDGRSEDVAEIYETQDLERARILLAKYDVDYVYIGPRERQKHGEDGFGKFDDLGENVFNQGDVSIYRIRR